MDLATVPATLPTELTWERDGVARDRELTPRVCYGSEYWQRYLERDQSPLTPAIDALRVAMVRRHCSVLTEKPITQADRDSQPLRQWPLPGLRNTKIIDVGIGGGSFLRAAISAGFDCRGYDVNQCALYWLIAQDLYADPYQCGEDVAAICLWDVLEHLPYPDTLLCAVRPGRRTFLSLPIVGDFARLSEWRHYRPGEHLWYFAHQGLLAFMSSRGFELLEHNQNETAAGRINIGSYAFVRCE